MERSDSLEIKLARLRAFIAQYSSVIVAFSGGADSAFVLAVCRQVLGKDRTLAVTGISASLASTERMMAESFAQTVDALHLLLPTDEMQDDRYTANPTNRCFFCKTELYGKLALMKSQRGFAAIFDGTNADDLSDFRPGRTAAAQHGILSPLAACGWTKQEIREASKRLNLNTWDKPAAPCLSSRIPHGMQVTAEKLLQIERAERVLHGLGFAVCRVRHHGLIARVEVALENLPRLLSQPTHAIVERELRAIGFHFVEIERRGFVSGGLKSFVASSVAAPTLAEPTP